MISATEKNVTAAGYAPGAWDCACCSQVVYGSVGPLCGECIAAECAPNRDGGYDECERPCGSCGDPRSAEFYVCVVWSRPGADVTYSDGYVCGDHLPHEDDMAGTFVPSDAEVHEVTVNELHRGIGGCDLAPRFGADEYLTAW